MLNLFQHPYRRRHLWLARKDGPRNSLRETKADREALHQKLHQKYPSCFFFSMLASPPSLSMTRPCRSLVVVSSIS